MRGLMLYDSAVSALAECKSVDEVMDWADKAAATQAYARMAKDRRLEVDAAEIRIRAERRLGEMLIEQKASGNMAKGHKFAGGTQTEPPAVTLAEVGIDKKLSARAQKIAKVPLPEFESELEGWRERVEAEGERVTARLEASGEQRVAPDERMADMAADYEAMARVIDSDDKLAAAWAEVKAGASKYAQLELLYDAQRRELAEMTRAAKRWRTKAEALEKPRGGA